jgi:hypothetical protein
VDHARAPRFKEKAGRKSSEASRGDEEEVKSGKTKAEGDVLRPD